MIKSALIVGIGSFVGGMLRFCISYLITYIALGKTIGNAFSDGKKLK